MPIPLPLPMRAMPDEDPIRGPGDHRQHALSDAYLVCKSPPHLVLPTVSIASQTYALHISQRSGADSKVGTSITGQKKTTLDLRAEVHFYGH
ncbi:GM18591 [Drosophila sechellia]|uniref:GM18591 n=1 Tax=Drosophila sechellia TaxID=7238 RepID=B4I1P3_DROSE|nr:GM18591 [Drosophila sechellia]